MHYDITPDANEPEEMLLHDDTIQMLFGISLKVEYCLDVLGDSPEQVRTGLTHVLGDLTDVITGLRNRVIALKTC
jgi:signal transduction histidine kinase